MTRINIFLAILIIYSCNPESVKENKKYEYRPKSIQRIYTGTTGHEIQGYTHYLTIEPFDENGDNFFVDYADKYRDTCRTDLPIWGITFCKSFDFKPYYDSRDDEILRRHSIVSIDYSEETLHKKYPDISSVTFYNDGKPIYVQIMTLDRMKNAGYYDSAGAYKRDWIKAFDSTFKTHFSDTGKNYR
jgi:hypothetical protein